MNEPTQGKVAENKPLDDYEHEGPGFVRLIDLYLTRPPETEDQKALRMRKEKEFLKLQTDLILTWTGEPDKNDTIEDYFEAGLPMGLIALISGKEMVEHIFIWDKIFGSPVKGKIRKYEIRVSKDNTINDHGERKIYNELFKDRNPGVLYAYYSRAVTMLEDGKNYNLFVLMEKDLSKDEILAVSDKAKEYYDILSYSEEYYRYKNRVDPWSNLQNAIGEILARIDAEA